jgi:ketosteroid isomerase-like protein
LRFGEPTTITTTQQGGKDYELWRYTKQNLTLVFEKQANGDFQLVHR